MSGADRFDEEPDELGLELRRLPSPVPDALVARVRARAHRQLAEQADERLSRWVTAFLLCFSWTASVLTYGALRLLSAGAAGLLGITTESASVWSVAYFGLTWISVAAVLVTVGLHRRREGRRA